MDDSSAAALFQIVFLLTLGLALAVIANKLAREKGRNVTLWTVLALIPIFNFLFMWYFVGASNLKLEQKVDEILRKLDK
jgi:hypothetical protein